MGLWSVEGLAGVVAVTGVDLRFEKRVGAFVRPSFKKLRDVRDSIFKSSKRQ